MSTNLFNINGSPIISTGASVFFIGDVENRQINKNGLITVFLDGCYEYSAPAQKAEVNGETAYIEPDGSVVPAAKSSDVWSYVDASGETQYRISKLTTRRQFAFSGPHAQAIKNMAGKGVKAFRAQFVASVAFSGSAYQSADGEIKGGAEEIHNIIQFTKGPGNMPTIATAYMGSVVPTGKKDGSVYGVSVNSQGIEQAHAPVALPRYAGKDGDGNAIERPDYASLLSSSPAVIEQFKLLAKGRHVWVRGGVSAKMELYEGEWRLSRAFSVDAIDTGAPTLGSGVGTMTCDPIPTKDGAVVYVKTRSDGRRRGETVDVDMAVSVFGEEAARMLKHGKKGDNIVIGLGGVSAGAWHDKRTGELCQGVNVTAYSARYPKVKNMPWAFITFGMGKIAQTPTVGALNNGQPISSLRVVSESYNRDKAKATAVSADVIGVGPIVSGWPTHLTKGRAVMYIATLLGAKPAFVPQTGESAGAPVSTLHLKQMQVNWLNRPGVGIVNGVSDAMETSAPAQDAASEAKSADAVASATDPIGEDSLSAFQKRMMSEGRKVAGAAVNAVKVTVGNIS